MPQTGPRCKARTRFADVLAEQISCNKDNAPVKKRKSCSDSSGCPTNTIVPQATPREVTYNLRLFGRNVDLAPFVNDNTASLYAVSRTWVDSDKVSKSHLDEDLPDPRLGPVRVEDMADRRIPLTVRDFKPALDLEQTFDKTFNTMAHHECLQINRERWTRVRKGWTEAHKEYESQYDRSFKILNEIFRSQQRDG